MNDKIIAFLKSELLTVSAYVPFKCDSQGKKSAAQLIVIRVFGIKKC